MPNVYIVDDDADVRALLAALLSSVSIASRSFASGVDFLRQVDRSYRGCVLLDVRMPEISGIEVAEHLRRRDLGLPVILMSAFTDVPMVIRAIKLGAVDFIPKPFNCQDFLDRVQEVLARIGTPAAPDIPERMPDQRLEKLTQRECQVLDLVLAGKLNREIAAELGIGLRTVETHRAQVMKKMACKSVAELFRIISSLPCHSVPV